MALSLTPRHFVTKMEENVKRVDDRLDDYIKDSNENNIHDIRTATRRLDASYMSLPKKIRRKTKIRKYVTTSKQLFKVNSQVRDCDIICEKLQKYSSEPIYTKLIGSLNRKRKTKLDIYFPKSHGNPIMLKFFYLGGSLREDVERRYSVYLKNDPLKLQTMLACSLLEISNISTLTINDALIKRMGHLQMEMMVVYSMTLDLVSICE